MGSSANLGTTVTKLITINISWDEVKDEAVRKGVGCVGSDCKPLKVIKTFIIIMTCLNDGKFSNFVFESSKVKHVCV